jgi:UDP-N-acetyl-D-mannosaminuronate dehydrogenase
MRATAIGHDLVGLDAAEDRVKALGAGESYVDDVSDAQVTTALESGRFLPSSSYIDATGVELLTSLGAQESVYDPHVSGEPRRDVARHTVLMAEVVRATNAVVMLVEHDERDHKAVARAVRWVLGCCEPMCGENLDNL